MTKKIIEIQRWLKTQVSFYRYKHIKGVAETAQKLAHRHGLPVLKAQISGWLHDCAKELSKDQMLFWIKKSVFKLDLYEEKMPGLWHPHAGASIAWYKWGIRDLSIIEAIRCHTLGHGTMKPLAQLIFVSDFVEPNRKFKNVKCVRIAAQKNLREAVCTKASMTIQFLIQKNVKIHPRLLETWNGFLDASNDEK